MSNRRSRAVFCVEMPGKEGATGPLAESGKPESTIYTHYGTIPTSERRDHKVNRCQPRSPRVPPTPIGLHLPFPTFQRTAPQTVSFSRPGIHPSWPCFREYVQDQRVPFMKSSTSRAPPRPHTGRQVFGIHATNVCSFCACTYASLL